MSTSPDRRARRAAQRHAANGAPTPPPGFEDKNAPDARPPANGLEQDIFNIAALVNTVKATFQQKEETALKVVDLAITILLTNQQLKAAGMPPMGAKILTPEEVAQRQAEALAEIEAEMEEQSLDAETTDSAPEPAIEPEES